MKHAAIQSSNNLLNNRTHAAYTIDLYPVIDLYTTIMKKLSNVSPFLMLLVPLFMMLVVTLTQQQNSTQQNESKKDIVMHAKKEIFFK